MKLSQSLLLSALLCTQAYAQGNKNGANNVAPAPPADSDEFKAYVALFDPALTLYGLDVPACNTPGQVVAFQGAPLFDGDGSGSYDGSDPNRCHRINICHGTGGGGQQQFKWNLITVSRSANGDIPGHTGYDHNEYDGKGKLPDYYPSTASRNPNGAGQYYVPKPNGDAQLYGSLDENCNWVPNPCEERTGACLGDPHFQLWSGDWYGKSFSAALDARRRYPIPQ